MKYKKRKERLERRIKDYEVTIAKTPVNSKAFKRPGSLNK